MKPERMIELLEIEHECMLRKSHNDCDGNCDDCDLVQDDLELHEMYTCVIDILKKKNKPKESRAKLPCVCGRKIKETWCGWHGDTPYYKILCPVCGRFGDGNSEIAAIRAWNRMVLEEKEKNLSAEPVEK